MPLCTSSTHQCGRQLTQLGFAGPQRRGFCTLTVVRRQRSPTSLRGRRYSKGNVAGAASASSKRNLLSPFGHVLQGSSRGPQGLFVEPLEAWLSVLADSVPFCKDCLVICPSTASDVQVRCVWNRCRQHIPAAHVVALTPRKYKEAQTTAADAAQTLLSLPNGTSTGDTAGAEAPMPLPAASLVPRGGGGGHLTSASTARLPSLYSPLEHVSPGSLDLIVLPSNVFAHEMLFDAPWHLSLAHRALRPHGVVAILGHVAEAGVGAPEWAATDARDYIESTHLDARETLRLAASDAARAPGTDDEHVRHLRRAVEVHETLRSGHADVFFPFPSVRRRWFTSEYALQPAQLAAHYRATPLYQVLYGPTGSLWWNKMRFRADVLQRQRTAASAVRGDEESFFVDITGTSLDGTASLGQGTESHLEDLVAAWSPLGVRRRRGVNDPLDMLQIILDAHTATVNASAAKPPLQVQLHHFVVTCSARSMNATPLSEGRTESNRNLLAVLGRGQRLSLHASERSRASDVRRVSLPRFAGQRCGT
ncbi:hypothetical protein, conserved [Leishmania donovani]|uniref:Uncharacterized protein n=1 Tax=Leishmania donovani TaxID=5661 RepID=E9BS99_LEIDO|nr:hypothetical protein, conserved [Leishmania donovani]AYU83028.1 hypothetical protein LdCL_350027800 [Leishmania donovani]CBZ38128.1 hypothetical protein, conserved [Leishmania donovani]